MWLWGPHERGGGLFGHELYMLCIYYPAVSEITTSNCVDLYYRQSSVDAREIYAPPSGLTTECDIRKAFFYSFFKGYLLVESTACACSLYLAVG
jgi:hypothetical protein